MQELFKELNPPQQTAVRTLDGPLLVLAGAGSGKTRVITYRILNLIRNKKVSPRHILGVTFTNKAANEMRQRINQISEKRIKGLTLSTFHSFGVKILKEHIHTLGYKNNFNIYDENDKKNLINSIFNEMNLDATGAGAEYNINIILRQISLAKNNNLFLRYFDRIEHEEYKLTVKNIYKRYEELLKNYNAVDFDDLIVLPIKILKKNEEIRESYHQQYQYILVDEYQDTNDIQYQFLKLLINKKNNICVVGDDDQAIYGFRGSKVEHILKFEKDFPNTKTVKLTSNYRSTPVILEAANRIIRNNKSRHEKEITSIKKGGSKILLKESHSELEEAEFVAGQILKYHHETKVPWEDMAVLYRTNFQSRPFEEAFRFKSIPYILIGGMQFYDRKEVKDILAYLKVIANEKDDMSLLRILNYPRRGIGDKSIYNLNQYSIKKKICLYDALSHAHEVEDLKSEALTNTVAFHTLIKKYKNEFFHSKKPMYRIAYDLVRQVKYEDQLKNEVNEPRLIKRKMYNISELISGIRNYEEEAAATGEKANLFNYLNRVSLLTKDEEDQEEEGKVSLMTFHLSKGLEFQVIFLVGIENDFLPHLRSIEDGTAIDEERRLFYVGITRAKDHLVISYARNRKKFGLLEEKQPSIFISEIPEEIITRPYTAIKDESERAEIGKNAVNKIKDLLQK
ncbi:MAG: UvrD-helicase domain-containing protein [Spirochaetes bacterium]|nr:UvrD-helicase domain-containing protein [Spirochaetota bacterium]